MLVGQEANVIKVFRGDILGQNPRANLYDAVLLINGWIIVTISFRYLFHCFAYFFIHANSHHL